MFSVRSKFAAGKLDEKILTEAEFGEADTSLRVQGKAPSERREHFPMDVGRHSLRAEYTSPSERSVLLPPGGACVSLRAERTTRFVRSEQLASGGADRMYWVYRCNSVVCPLQLLLAVKLGEKY